MPSAYPSALGASAVSQQPPRHLSVLFLLAFCPFCAFCSVLLPCRTLLRVVGEISPVWTIAVEAYCAEIIVPATRSASLFCAHATIIAVLR